MRIANSIAPDIAGIQYRFKFSLKKGKEWGKTDVFHPIIKLTSKVKVILTYCIEQNSIHVVSKRKVVDQSEKDRVRSPDIDLREFNDNRECDAKTEKENT